MHLVLLAVGVAVAVVGLVLLVLALPLDTAALGNTFILAGTVAIVGSLILIAIASAVRQLRRIAQALETRPATRTLAADEEAAPRLHSPVLTPPTEPRAGATEPRAAEPRLAMPPPLPPAVAPEPAAAPDPAVALPPEPPPIPPTAPVPDIVAERLIATDVASEPPPAEEPEPLPMPEPPPMPQPLPMAEPPRLREPPPPPPPPPPPAPPTPRRIFEAVWSGESEVREREPVAADSSTLVAERPAPPLAAEPEVRIFKSGVIDGMAYTLYTDGSIEAQLADRTVVFASIDELRAYLAARE